MKPDKLDDCMTKIDALSKRFDNYVRVRQDAFTGGPGANHYGTGRSKFKIGQRVRWGSGDTGTIAEVIDAGDEVEYKIKKDNPGTSPSLFINKRDRNLERVDAMHRGELLTKLPKGKSRPAQPRFDADLPQLTPEEVAECRRHWRSNRKMCEDTLRHEGRPVSEQGWMDWCKHCMEEYGASPFGT